MSIESERILRFVQVDAFTAHSFSGNPAVIFEPGPEVDAKLMQNIALEMNVSETAFLVPQATGYNLRWFTPADEVDLCGHATLAAAHALWTVWGEEGEAIKFETLSGELGATREGDTIWLDFPAEPVSGIEILDIHEALGLEPRFTGRNRMDYLAELESESEVRGVSPDLRMIQDLGFRGLIVTARSDEGSEADFVSRFFAPGLGVDEDPVTGSAHCALGPYWASKLGRLDLVGYQVSSRGGTVRVRVRDDRVDLGGSAVTVFRGELEAIR